MLRTRLWMGALLAALAAGVLVVDRWLEPWYPFLFALVLAAALLACFELLHLLPPPRRPAGWLCYAGVAGRVAAHWGVPPGGPPPRGGVAGGVPAGGPFVVGGGGGGVLRAGRGWGAGGAPPRGGGAAVGVCP